MQGVPKKRDDGRGNVRIDADWSHEPASADVLSGVDSGGEWMTAGDRLEEDNGQAPEIEPDGRRLALECLRRKVRQRSGRLSQLHESREAEVEELRRAFVRKCDVTRLDVPVQHALSVHVFERVEQRQAER